jgi:hypothetical protein
MMNKTCPKCQTENLTTAKFCKKCGSPLDEAQYISNSTITDNKLYETAMEEIESSTVQKGLYARAFSQSEGDKDKTDALYIRLRVQSLQDELMLEAEQERALDEKQISDKIRQEEEEQQQLVEEKKRESQLEAKKAMDVLLQQQEKHWNNFIMPVFAIVLIVWGFFISLIQG